MSRMVRKAEIGVATLERKASEAASLLKLLANENRLLILCQLVKNGEMSVTELADAVGLSQSALSQHLAKMRQAARAFIGKHDFEAFAANRGYKMESTVRTVTRCEIRRVGPLLTVTIEGDGFLYKMCRGIVGTLAQVGQNKFAPIEIPRMLATKDRRAAGMSAPAHGLVLWKVFYGKRSAAAADEAANYLLKRALDAG